MTTNNTSKVIFLVFALSFASNSLSALPVFDPSNLRQNIRQYIQLVEQVRHELKQVEQMAVAIQRAEDQLGAITGPRGIGQLLNGPEYRLIRRHLPHDTRRVLDDLRRGRLPRDKKGLSDGLEALLAVYDIFQDYNELSSEQLREQAEVVRQESLSNNAVGQVMAEESLRIAGTSNIENLEELMAEIDNSPDIKHTLDLIARLSIENSLLINQLIQVQAGEAARNSRNDLSTLKARDLDRTDNSLERFKDPDYKWP